MDRNNLTALLISKLKEAGIESSEAELRVRAFLKSLNDSDVDVLLANSSSEQRLDLVVNAIKEMPMPKARTPQRSASRGSQRTSPPQDKAETASELPTEAAAQSAQTPQAPHEAETGKEHAASDDEEPDISLINEAFRKRGESDRSGAARGINMSTGTAAEVNPIPTEAQKLAENAKIVPEKHPQPAPVPHQPAAASHSAAAEQRDASHSPAASASPQQKSPARTSAGNTDKLKKSPQKAPSRPANTPDKKIIHRPDPNADYRKFYIILACTSPLWVLALLFVLTVFIGALVFMAAAIALLFAGMVVVVVGGTAISLVGIIYGITQIFSYAPIGEYEIGLGVIIGGLTMLIGVVAYNVAIRLLPYLIKKTVKLLTFTMHKCVELYYYVKGECADL
ncbi:MAG: hypothetical protein LUH54_03980 [Firmicutes bacterium]|nr:hypothetical protein [Bacillota bacterium]